MTNKTKKLGLYTDDIIPILDELINLVKSFKSYESINASFDIQQLISTDKYKIIASLGWRILFYELKLHGIKDRPLVSELSNLISYAYFRSALIYTACFIVWSENVTKSNIFNSNESKSKILLISFKGLIGYRLRDLFYDEKSVSPNIALFSEAIIKDFESNLIELLNFDIETLHDYQKEKMIFTKYEFRENYFRDRRCFFYEELTESGGKSLMLFLPLLASICKEKKDIEKYRTMFICFSSVIQLLDDYRDLEEDIKAGYMSYTITFVMKRNPDLQIDSIQIREFLKEDKASQEALLKEISETMDKAIELATVLKDDFFISLNKFLFLRVVKFFEENIKLGIK